MVQNKLKLNKHKTKLLLLSAHYRPCPSINYTDVSSEQMQLSLSAKNIGVIFYQHLSLNQHVTSFCKSCFFHLRSIAKIRDCSSTTNTEILVQACITSRLDSCNSLQYGLPKFLIDCLHNVQNSTAWLITRSRKHHHIMKQPPRLPISQRVIFKLSPTEI